MGAQIKFADLRAGEVIFMDANPLVDHFSANPKTGLACRALIGRIAAKEVGALTSAHIVAEMAHPLMTIEACAVFGWPYKGIAQKLARHPTEVRQLSGFRQAVEAVSTVGIQILPVLPITSWPPRT